MTSKDYLSQFSLPDDFEKVLATCRGRGISINIIIQNLAQIKALFKDSWENITGNCDSFLFLGGNEKSTHKYVSEMLGKETIDTQTRGLTKGRSGSSSKNFQNAGRDLLTPDEVRKLDDRHAILFIRGEDPIIDDKFDILKHPNIKLTTDGGAEPIEFKEKLKPQIQKDLRHLPDIKNIEIIELEDLSNDDFNL